MKEKMSVPPAPPSVQLGKWKPWVHAVDNFVVIEPTRDRRWLRGESHKLDLRGFDSHSRN